MAQLVCDVSVAESGMLNELECRSPRSPCSPSGTLRWSIEEVVAASGSPASEMETSDMAMPRALAALASAREAHERGPPAMFKG